MYTYVILIGLNIVFHVHTNKENNESEPQMPFFIQSGLMNRVGGGLWC
jgi:hypothetical protein